MTQKIEEWVLTHYGQEVYTPGLARISQAIATLKPTLQQKKIVIITGTNGKGETTHRLSHLFKEATFCTWTSPHITSITERFRSEKGDISENELEKLIQESHVLVQSEKYQLTYYEFLFFVFCRWAVEKNPEHLFLEVGLGGRLDAVNALDAQTVLLTSISRDHQEFLGNRYDLILQEKLGVLRKGATLFSYLDLGYLQEKVEDIVQKTGAHHCKLNSLKDIPAYEFSLRNQFLAYAAYCQLTKSEILPQNWVFERSGLASRGEVVKGKNDWWLFGSHNVDGMRKLIQFLHSGIYNFKDSPFDLIVTSFSKRNEKDIRVMLRMLKAAGIGKVVVTAFEHPKAFSANRLEELASQEGLEFAKDIADHVQGWTHQKILVAGSYYLLGKLEPLFRSK